VIRTSSKSNFQVNELFELMAYKLFFQQYYDAYGGYFVMNQLESQINSM
jgi:hypothetical protein